MSERHDTLLKVFFEQRDALLGFLTRKLGNRALAEDLTQETWLRAATVAPSKSLGSPRSYLFRIASNLALDHQRRVGLGIEVPTVEHAVVAVPDPAPSPEQATVQRRELDRLLEVVDDLPPRCREVFLLVKVQGMSYAEAANHLGLAKNTVMAHLARALAALDRALSRSHRQN